MTETTTYLGFTFVVGARTVEVWAPGNRYIGVAYSMSGARRIVRGYRKAA